MRHISLLVALSLTPASLLAQPGTEVYLFDLELNDGTYSVSNPINISDNPGYDNQPHFSKDGETLYFTSNRDGETDLLGYTLSTGNKTWITNTTGRSEYSPTITPDSQHLSFISLTPDGVQEFRKINIENGKEELIEADRIIGYFVWMNASSYLCFVLATEETPSTLQIHDIETTEKTTVAENPGRSFHKIPGAKAFSYILNSESGASIYAYYPETGTSDLITDALPESQDMAWTPNGDILMGKDSMLYAFLNGSWVEIADLKEYNLTGITRLAVSAKGDKIAIVVEE